MMVAEYQHGATGRAGEVVEPCDLVGAELAAVGAGDDGVDDRQRHAVDLHVVGRVAGGKVRVRLHVVVATYPLHALPERAVGVEEGLELVFGAGVREISFDHDDVGIEGSHFLDHGTVHDLGVRRVAGLGAQDRSELLGPEIAEPTALDLAEMHVVRGRDRREEAAARSFERGERRREPLPVHGPVDLQRVPGSRVEAHDPRRVVRAGRRDLGVADPGGDRLVAVGAERDHGLVGPDRHELGVVHAGHRAHSASGSRPPADTAGQAPRPAQHACPACRQPRDAHPRVDALGIPARRARCRLCPLALHDLERGGDRGQLLGSGVGRDDAEHGVIRHPRRLQGDVPVLALRELLLLRAQHLE